MFSNIAYDYKQGKTFFLGLDGKNSVVGNVPIKLFGIQYGHLYNKRSTFHIGFYASHNDEKIISGNSIEPDSTTIYQKHQLLYMNLGCEYYYYDSRKWRFSIPFSFGIGEGKSYRRRIDNIHYDKQSRSIIPLELGFKASYKLTWYLWINGGLGARVSLRNGQYNGSFYSFGLALKTDEIIRRVKAWQDGEALNN